MTEKPKIIVEATGLQAPENERFVARAHLGEGSENMRHAYGATMQEAERALRARLAHEAADGKGGEHYE